MPPVAIRRGTASEVEMGQDARSAQEDLGYLIFDSL